MVKEIVLSVSSIKDFIFVVWFKRIPTVRKIILIRIGAIIDEDLLQISDRR